MNKYAYRVYKNGSLADPVFGGTVSAKSMDEATSQVINQCKITCHHDQNPDTGLIYHYFTCKGIKVGIVIYANPEN